MVTLRLMNECTGPIVCNGDRELTKQDITSGGLSHFNSGASVVHANNKVEQYGLGFTETRSNAQTLATYCALAGVTRREILVGRGPCLEISTAREFQTAFSFL
jgi:hypothetical protein